MVKAFCELPDHRSVLSCQPAGQDLFPSELREHLLNIIVGCPHHLVPAEPDQIRRPLVQSVARHQRRITAHRYHIAVSFDAGQISCFAQRTVKIVRPPASRGRFMRRILAKEYLCPSGIQIISVRIPQKPSRFHVVVLVHCVVRKAAQDSAPAGIEQTAVCHRSAGNDTYNIRICFFHFRPDLLIPVKVDVCPVLVPDGKKPQVERLLMSHLPTQSAPVRFRIPQCEFQQVQDILRPCCQRLIVHRRFIGFPGLAQQAAAHDRQRQCSDFLTQAEVLIKADTIALHIAPGVPVLFPLFHRTDSILPPVQILPFPAAFRNTSSGEAQKTGMKLLQGFHKIPSHSASGPFCANPVPRHQGSHIRIQRTCFLQNNDQAGILRCRVRPENSALSAPFCSGYHGNRIAQKRSAPGGQ